MILFVIQLVMFGMGTQMRIKDFTNVKTMGKGVLVGVLCQFSIMPLVGYMLTRVFNFEPDYKKRSSVAAILNALDELNNLFKS